LAILLAFFFMAAWSVKATHAFWVHADHHDRPTCLVEKDHVAQHIHDARYAGDDCSFCAGVLSVASLPGLLAWLELQPISPAAQSRFHYFPPVICFSAGATPVRGPPRG